MKQLAVGSWQLTVFLLFFCFCVMNIAACEEKTEAPIDLQYDYFPLAVGKYWVYQVDSILFVPTFGTTRLDSATNFIKEEIIESFVDNAGDTIYRVERLERKNNAESWQIKKVFAIQRSRTQAIQTEDNLRFIKLVFPLQEGKNWNSTAFPTEGLTIPIASQQIEIFNHWESEATAIGEPLQVGSFNFDKTATIFYANETTITTEYRVAAEVYAKGIGLVKRDWSILDTQCKVCCNGPSAMCVQLPWEKKAEKGFILKQILIAHN